MTATMLAADVSELTVGRYLRKFREAGIPRGAPERHCRFADWTEPPPNVLANRARLAPRSIVAAIAGDPLPGYSRSIGAEKVHRFLLPITAASRSETGS